MALMQCPNAILIDSWYKEYTANCITNPWDLNIEQLEAQQLYGELRAEEGTEKKKTLK